MLGRKAYSAVISMTAATVLENYAHDHEFDGANRGNDLKIMYIYISSSIYKLSNNKPTSV